MATLCPIGMVGSEEFLHTVCALVEIIAKHPAILMEHRELVIDEILPPLAQLVSSSFGQCQHGLIGMYCLRERSKLMHL